MPPNHSPHGESRCGLCHFWTMATATPAKVDTRSAGPRAAGVGRKKGVPNKATAEIKAIAAQYGPDAIAALAEIIKNRKSPAASRVAAATVLLDRAYGKATQAVQVSGTMELRKLSDEELDARIAQLMAAAGVGNGS